MADDTYGSALDLIARYRAREVSPVEVLQAVQQRAEQVEPAINAFVDTLDESALAAAREAEARYAGRGGGDPRPLEGVPVATKEEQPIAGLSWRMGSLVTEGMVADETHPVVERVRAAGGVVHARTTTPEFSCAGFTHTELWGVTRNPWNPDYGPGGSSGGSGAALAAGTAYLATGSDIGGSIRLPSSLCGVVGFKPPYGRVPGMPPFNLDVYCHDGPMGRSVADVAHLQNLIAGPHRLDPIALPPAAPLPDSLGDVASLEVALAVTFGDYPVDPDVEQNTRAFADALREAGVKVSEIDVPITRDLVQEAALAHFGAIFGPSVTPPGEEPDPRLMPYTKHFLDLSREAFDTVGFYGGLEREAKVQGMLGEVFASYDVLICPTLGSVGFLAGDNYVDHGVTVDGVDLPMYLEGAFTPIFNICSRHPVVNVPSGRASNGVPTGIQVVGRAYDDATPFHVAAAAERVLDWWNDPAWRPAL